MKNAVLLLLIGAVIGLSREQRSDYNELSNRIDVLQSEKTKIGSTVDNLYNNELTTISALEYLATRIGNIEDLLGLQ